MHEGCPAGLPAIITYLYTPIGEKAGVGVAPELTSGIMSTSKCAAKQPRDPP